MQMISNLPASSRNVGKGAWEEAESNGSRLNRSLVNGLIGHQSIGYKDKKPSLKELHMRFILFYIRSWNL